MNRHLLLAIYVIGAISCWAFSRRRTLIGRRAADQQASEQWESEGGAPLPQA